MQLRRLIAILALPLLFSQQLLAKHKHGHLVPARLQRKYCRSARRACHSACDQVHGYGDSREQDPELSPKRVKY
jgi:hypothetical protein